MGSYPGGLISGIISLLANRRLISRGAYNREGGGGFNMRFYGTMMR